MNVTRILGRLVFGWLITMLFLLPVSFFISRFYVEPKAKVWLQTKGSDLFGTPLTIETVKLNLGDTLSSVFEAQPTLSFSLKQVKLRGSQPHLQAPFGPQFEVRQINMRYLVNLASLTSRVPYGRLQLQLIKPKFQIATESSDTVWSTPHLMLPEFNKSSQGARKISAELVIDDGSVEFIESRSTAAAPAVGTPAPAAPSPSAVLKHLKLHLLDTDITKLDFAVDASATLFLRSVDTALGHETEWPLVLKSRAGLEGEVLTFSESELIVAGMPLAGGASYHLISGATDWSFKTAVKDIAQVTRQLHFLPLAQWSGLFDGDVHALTTAKNSGWMVSGQVHLRNAEMKKTEFDAAGFQFAGDMKADLGAQFAFKSSLENFPAGLKLSDLSLTTDLEKLKISREEFFLKSPGVALNAQLKGNFENQVLTLAGASFQLANLKSSASGSLSLSKLVSGLSDLNIRIPETDLAGWQKLSPAFDGAPVTGKFELTGHFKGSVFHPATAEIELAPFALRDFSGNLRWRNANGSQTLSGVVKGNTELNWHSIGADIKAAQLKLLADLTQLSIELRGQMEKRSGAVLSLKALATQDSSTQALSLHDSELTAYSNHIALSGTLQDLVQPQLKFLMEFKQANLGELTQPFSQLATQTLSGLLTATARFENTSRETSNGETSNKVSREIPHDTLPGSLQTPARPLRMSVDAKIEVPALKLTGPSLAQALSISAPLQMRPALLPNWEILNTAEIKMQLLFGKIQTEALLAEGVHLLASYTNGKLRASGTIEKFLDGEIKINQFETHPADPQPASLIDAEASHLSLGALAQFFQKASGQEWGGLFDGSGSGHIRLERPPNQGFVTASGSLKIGHGRLGSKTMKELINLKPTGLAQAAGTKAPASVGTAAADQGVVQTEFTTSRDAVLLHKFRFENGPDLFDAQGSIGFDKKLDLSGMTLLEGATGKLHLSGTLTHPEISAFAENKASLHD